MFLWAPACGYQILIRPTMSATNADEATGRARKLRNRGSHSPEKDSKASSSSSSLAVYASQSIMRLPQILRFLGSGCKFPTRGWWFIQFETKTQIGTAGMGSHFWNPKSATGAQLRDRTASRSWRLLELNLWFVGFLGHFWGTVHQFPVLVQSPCFFGSILMLFWLHLLCCLVFWWSNVHGKKLTSRF